MTDASATSEPTVEPESTPSVPLSPVQEQVAAIRAERAAKEAAVVAANQAEEVRCAALDAVKARCAAECGEVVTALEAATDPVERQALVDLEARTHAAHASDLEAAYGIFSGQRAGESNPALAGETMQLDSAAVVSSEIAAVQ